MRVADVAVYDNIVVITVPEGKNKPYSCSKGFYLRSGPNSQKLERDSIIEFFQNEGRVRVEIFDDRVDIVNPGGVCKGITHENFGTISITRNSIVASMLHRSGYIEQMGTGIKRMRNAARDAQVAEPEFELSGFFKVTFKRTQPDTLIDRQSATIGRDSR